jgi:glycosyltransferase involved in cell wall biosynthesis
MRLFGIPSGGSKFWSWLCKKADALVTCNARDQQFLDILSMQGKPVFYLPWPAYVPEGFKKQKKDGKSGIYAGSLHPSKDIQVFEQVIPQILEETPTKKFIIVGTGALATIIEKLRQTFPDAIEYYPQLPRFEVLKLISSSYYGYSPSRPGLGYGFIADCWGTETPILLNHNVSFSKNIDASVVRDTNELIVAINRLYEDPRFYERLQKSGYDEYNKRSPGIVADKLYNIFEKTYIATLRAHESNSHSSTKNESC